MKIILSVLLFILLTTNSFAAFVHTQLTSGTAIASSGSFTTSSITPVANDLTLIAIYNTGTGAGVSAVSGDNLTWTLIDTKVTSIGVANGIATESVYYGVGSSPSSGVLTVSTGSLNTSYYQIIDVSGQASSSPIVQHSDGAETVGGTSVAISPNLNTYASSNNEAFAFAVSATAGVPASTASAGPSMTALVSGGNIFSEYSTTTGSPVAVAATTSSTKGIIIGFEISAPSSTTAFSPIDSGG